MICNLVYSRFHRVQSSFTKQLQPPTARAGSVRRFCSPASPPPPPPPTPPPASPPPPGDGGGSGGGPQWTRLALQLGAGLVAVAGLAVGSLPAVLSTHWGIQKAMELVNTQLPGRVEVAEARLTWLGGNELQCVKVYDSPRGGTILMHLNRVTTSASLWALLAGSGDFNVVIAKPWINTAYDTKLADFKLVNFLENVGLLSPPPPPQENAPLLQPPQLDVDQKTEPSKTDPSTPHSTGPEAIAVAVAPQVSQQQQLPQQPQQQQQQKPSSGGRQSPSSLVGVLARVNAKMDLNADVRLGRMNLVVTDGMLLVAEEMRQILGPRVHVTGAVGHRQLREWGEEVGEEVGWAASGQSAPPEVARNPGRYQPGVLQVLADHLRGEMRVWKAADHTLLQQPATARLDLTPALSRLGLAAANPLLGNVVEVRGGERLDFRFMPEGGRLPYNAATAEMAPVTLSLGPASLAAQLLNELGLKTHTPASTSTSTSTSSTQLTASGSRGLSASLSRMRVHFTRGGQLRTERVDMQLGGAAVTTSTTSPGGATTSTTTTSSIDTRGGHRTGGQAATPVEQAGAEIAVAEGAAGKAEAVQGGAGGGGGGTGRGVHVAVWGSADLQRDQVDFTLGVATGPLLGAMGLRREGLPEGYLLLVPLRGAAAGGGVPRYEMREALLRLGQIAARQKAVQWLEGREQRREEAGSGEAVRGLLGDLLVAAAAPQDLVAKVDQRLLRDMERIPPPAAAAEKV